MSKLKSDIAFIVHDLRNNTGAAISHLQLLLLENKDLINNKDIKYAVENLNQSIQLSNEISKKLVNSDANNTDILKNTVVRCDTHFLETAKAEYEKLEKTHGIKINQSFTTAKDINYISVNLPSLISMRENIVTNAKKSGATVIDFSVEMKEYCAIITFKDNGSGMTEDDINKIYLKKHGDGVIKGLGTKSILNTIEKHTGVYVEYKSEINIGTTIRLLVPYETQPII